MYLAMHLFLENSLETNDEIVENRKVYLSTKLINHKISKFFIIKYISYNKISKPN